MILIIDNYDSFTFNLYQYLGEMDSHILVKKNDEISLDEISELSPTHIVISPGPGTPDRAGRTMKIIQSFSASIPILGVCLGYQAMGMVFGATLVKAPVIFHGKTSKIYHDRKGILRGVDSPFEAMRYHSWIIDASSLSPEIEVLAFTEDKIPMALQHRYYPLCGVQFHPESILTPEGKKILRNFLSDCNFHEK